MPTTDAPGFPVHFEALGAGPATAFLHGGLESSADHAGLLAALAETRRVIAPDRRGHGRTADVEGPYTYRGMVDETAAVLEAVAAMPADVVGFSDGADIALELAVRRPELVRAIVAISGNLDADGLEPAMLERLEAPDPDSPGLQPIREAYVERSPDGPGHWATFHAKVCAMGAAGPGLTLDHIAAISCPVLVVCGDDDVVRLEHTVAMFRALPDAQLAVVPGTSHLLLHEKPDLVTGLVHQFLAAPRAERLRPMRR
jgi:pimeloyl-ACP methyl ester carboxylesterase